MYTLPRFDTRHLFDIPDDVAFLNCAYMSPLTRASVMAGERGLRRKLHVFLLMSCANSPRTCVYRELRPY